MHDWKRGGPYSHLGHLCDQTLARLHHGLQGLEMRLGQLEKLYPLWPHQPCAGLQSCKSCKRCPWQMPSGCWALRSERQAFELLAARSSQAYCKRPGKGKKPEHKTQVNKQGNIYDWCSKASHTLVSALKLRKDWIVIVLASEMVHVQCSTLWATITALLCSYIILQVLAMHAR